MLLTVKPIKLWVSGEKFVNRAERFVCGVQRAPTRYVERIS
jgi:hypothetical protein